MILNRIKENKFYILFSRDKGKNTCPKYVIYRSNEFGGDLLKEFRYLREAKRIFNKATKEAIQYVKEMLND